MRCYIAIKRCNPPKQICNPDGPRSRPRSLPRRSCRRRELEIHMLLNEPLLSPPVTTRKRTLLEGVQQQALLWSTAGFIAVLNDINAASFGQLLIPAALGLPLAAGSPIFVVSTVASQIVLSLFSGEAYAMGEHPSKLMITTHLSRLSRPHLGCPTPRHRYTLEHIHSCRALHTFSLIACRWSYHRDHPTPHSHCTPRGQRRAEHRREGIHTSRYVLAHLACGRSDVHHDRQVSVLILVSCQRSCLESRLSAID